MIGRIRMTNKSDPFIYVIFNQSFLLFSISFSNSLILSLVLFCLKLKSENRRAIEDIVSKIRMVSIFIPPFFEVQIYNRQTLKQLLVLMLS